MSYAIVLIRKEIKFKLIYKYMKKLFSLFFIAIIAIAFNSNDLFAQFNYTRTSFTGAYTPITTGGGATISTATGDISMQIGAPIGFTFNYNGVNYTTINMATDGYASFAYTTATGSNTNLYAAGVPAVLAPWWDDLTTGAGNILYQTQGAVGSRTFTIQWTNVSSYWSTPNRVINFQVILYETSNRIELRYGTSTGPLYNAFESASIGINSQTGGINQYIDAITGSKLSNNSMMTSNKWPTLFYRFDPGVPSTLAGTYNVGVGQTYPSLSEAIADLNHRGISGAVTLNLTDANYDTTVANGSNIFPLVVGPISGSSSVNTVTITTLLGSSTLTYSGTLAGNIGNQATTAALGTGNEPIIALVGADYVTISKLNLYSRDTRMHNLEFNLDRGIQVINSSAVNGSQNNTIQNCTFRIGKTTSAGLGTGFIALEQSVPTIPISSAGANSFNRYYNNTVDSSYNGFNFTGNATYPDLNTEVAGVSGGQTIIGGNFFGAIGNNTTSTYGIQATNQNGISIYNCLVRNVVHTSTSFAYGINLNNSSLTSGVTGTNNIYNNDITSISRNVNTTTTGNVVGIRMDMNTGSTVNCYNNEIDSLNFFNPTSAVSATTVAGMHVVGIACNSLSASGSRYNVYYNSVNISIGGNFSNTTCMLLGAGTHDVEYRNNAFSNKSAIRTSLARNFVVWRIATGTILPTSSNNVLHAANLGAANLTFTGYWSGLGTTDRLTLINWQTSPMASTPAVFETIDMGSSSSDPLFTSMTNLTLTAGSSAINSGRPIGGYATDRNGVSRDATNPDIGANETGLSAVTDTHGPFLSYTPIINSSTPTLTLTVTDNINGATANARLWTRVAGSGSAFAERIPDVVPGTRNGNYIWNASLGPLAAGNYEYYIVVRDGILNNTTATPIGLNTSAPIFTTDPTAANYTINPLVGVNWRTFTKFGAVIAAGSYDIGDDQPAGYRNLTQLVSTINASEIGGNVIFELNATYGGGVYPEVFPITFSPFATTGGSPFTVTIRPKSGVSTRVTQGSATPLININGGDRYIFDGRAGGVFSANNKQGEGDEPEAVREWIIRNQSVGTSPTFQFINDATGNTLQYLVIESPNNSTFSGTIVFSTTATPIGGVTGNDNNTIDNCDIRDRSDVAGLPLNGIYALGTTTTVALHNSGNIISNNNIYNFYGASSTANGIQIAGGNTDWTITGNSFYQTVERYNRTIASTDIAINVIPGSLGNNFVISNNFIGGTSPSAGGSRWTIGPNTFASRFIGIQLSVGFTTPSSVQNNVVTNFSLATSGAFSTQWGNWAGIYVSAGSANIGTVTGNIIGSGTGNHSVVDTSTVSGGITVGISAQSISPAIVNISNNTIGSITASALPSTNAAGVYGILLTSTAVYNVNNNTIGSTSTANSLWAANPQTTGSFQLVLGIRSQGTALTNTFTNNTIANLYNNGITVGSNAVAIKGIEVTGGVNIISGNTIRNLSTQCQNTFTPSVNCAVIGIQMSAITAPPAAGNRVTGNIIHSLSNTDLIQPVSVVGIVYAGPTSGTNIVDKNFIHSSNLSTSSTTAQMVGILATGGVANYQNNMVRLGINPAGGSITTPYIIVGIDKIVTTNNNFYFNSVYIGGSGVGATAVNTFAFRRTATATDDIRNNIFVNARSNATTGGKHYAISLNATTTLTCNYHSFFTPGTGGVMAVNAGIDYSSLAAWTVATGFDGNSFVANPSFINATGGSGAVDLHVNTFTPIEGTGQLIASVTDDYDSQVRSVNTPTDIGADAGLFTWLDNIPPAISYTLLGNQAPAPNRSFTGVTITDLSGINTTPGTRPRCYYKKSTHDNAYTGNTAFNNGWKWVESNGATSPFDFTIDYTILLGGGVAGGEIIQYFVVAQDLYATPNVGINSGTFFGTPANVADYANIFPLGPTINQYFISSLYSGTYTVGTNFGDQFPTLTGGGGLFEALNAGIMSGNITALVTSDLVEPGTNALNQITYDVAGANYTLRIVPQTASEKLISGSVAGAMINFNGNDFVTIDGNNGLGGRFLRFRNTNGLNPTFLFQNDARRNTITDCFIESNNAAALGTSATIVIGGTTFTQGNDSLFFINCDIRDRSDAAGTPITAILASGNTAAPNNHMLISGCNIYNTFNAAATFVDLYFLAGNADMTIQNNSFYQTATRSPSNAAAYFCMIMATDGSNNALTGNFLGGTAPLCGGTPMTFTDCAGMLGFRIFTTGIASPTTASGNTIANMDIGYTGIGAAFLFRAFDINGATSAFVNCTNNTIGSQSANDNIIIRFNPAASAAGPGPCAIAFGFTSGTLGFPIGSVTGNTIGGITLTGTGTTSATTMSLTGIGIGPTVNTAVNVTGNTVGGTVANSFQNTMAVNTNALTMNAISSTAVTNVTGVNISNNTVRNLTNSSINTTASFVRGIFHSGTAGFNANNNTIHTFNSATTRAGSLTTPDIVGIFSTSAALNQTINENTIFNFNATTTGAFSPVVAGIGMTSSTATMTQSRNRIYGLTNTATGSPQIYGIINWWGATTGSGCLAINNQISITNGELTDSHLPERPGIGEINSDLSTNLGTSLLGQNTKGEMNNNQSRELGIYQQPIIQQQVIQQPVYQSRELGINQNNNRVNGMNKNTNGKGSSDPTVSEGEIYVTPPEADVIKKPIYQTDALNGLTIFGIYDDALSAAWNYYYNSVYVGGEANTGTLTSFSFRKTSSANNIINNIFYNGRRNSGTATGNHYAYSSTGTPSVNTNYNVFINVNPATLFSNSGVDQTIGAWRTATGRDRQSWSTTASDVTPAELFTNVLNGNLNIVTASPEAWIVSGKGIALTGQNIDFNGNARVTSIASGTTDIGSNEIAPLGTTTPLATQDNAPGSGVTSTYTLWSRPIAQVVWGTGGTLYPTTLNVFYNSGINPPGTLGGNFSNSHTIVNPIGSMPDTRYNITYFFGDNETFTIGSPATNTVLAKYDGATWEVFPLVRPEWNTTLVFSTATQTFTATVVGLWDFGTFALTDNSAPLPVALESFEIAVNKRDAILNWSTTSEINNQGFGVERRIKLEKGYSAWVEKGFVNGSGTTNERRQYTYKDVNLVSGVYQYRLRQVDYNNNIEYYQPGNNSDITIGKPGTFDLSQNYPNPSNPKSKIDFQMPFDGKVSIKIYDILGREVATLINDFKPADFYTVEFDGTNIASGTYFYRIIAEGGNQKFTKTLKMILVK